VAVEPDAGDDGTDVASDVGTDVGLDVGFDVVPDAGVDAVMAMDVSVDAVDAAGDAVDAGDDRRDAGPSWHTVPDVTSSTPWHGDTRSTTVRGCNAGELMTGVLIRSSQYVNALGFYCGHLEPDGALTGIRRIDVVGGDHGTVADEPCPVGQVVVRFDGRSGSVVDRLQAFCAPVPGWYATHAAATPLGVHGMTGGDPWSDACPEHQMANGLDFGIGYFDDSDRVQRFRFRCVGVEP
jgi:hypothetical protein